MITFFAILRAIRAAFLGLRALAGILILSHGIYVWTGQKRLR
jgi:hypothetical protein